MYYSAFIMGLIGSLHCIGMCGPIAMMLPGDKEKRLRFAAGRLLYNAGRILTYGILGLSIGYFGEKLAFISSQKTLSIGLGVLILTGVLWPKRWLNKINPYNPLVRFTQKIKSSLSFLFKKHFWGTQFVFGLLNGLLPCGLVYAALSGAFLMTDSTGGFLFMILFGAGTLPMMLGASLGASFIRKKFKLNFSRIIPVTYGLLAIWLIVRGISINNPGIIHQHQNASEITICH